MTRRGDPSRLPEPPWTQAPSEVAAWLGSVGGRPPSRPRPPPRHARVRGFRWRASPIEARRLLRRLARHRFERVEMGIEHVPRAVARWVGRSPTRVFQGTIAGARMRVVVRVGTAPELRIEFHPRVSERVAVKVLARLGVRASDGMWL